MNINIITFLPIISIVIIIFLIFRFIRGTTTNHRKKMFRGKSLKLFFSCYLAILLVSVILFTFIPFKEFGLIEDIENGDKLQSDIFYDAIYEGKIDQMSNVEIGEKFTFEYNEDTLNLSVNTNEFLEASVFVEKKNTNDKVIEITNYVHPVIVDNMKLTEKNPSIKAMISGNTLVLQPPQQVSLYIVKIKKEFTIRQFTGEPWTFDSVTDFGGENVLYIKIPKNLELVSTMDNIDVHYVSE